MRTFCLFAACFCVAAVYGQSTTNTVGTSSLDNAFNAALSQTQNAATNMLNTINNNLPGRSIPLLNNNQLSSATSNQGLSALNNFQSSLTTPGLNNNLLNTQSTFPTGPSTTNLLGNTQFSSSLGTTPFTSLTGLNSLQHTTPFVGTSFGSTNLNLPTVSLQSSLPSTQFSHFGQSVMTPNVFSSAQTMPTFLPQTTGFQSAGFDMNQVLANGAFEMSNPVVQDLGVYSHPGLAQSAMPAGVVTGATTMQSATPAMHGMVCRPVSPFNVNRW